MLFSNFLSVKIRSTFCYPFSFVFWSILWYTSLLVIITNASQTFTLKVYSLDYGSHTNWNILRSSNGGRDLVKGRGPQIHYDYGHELLSWRGVAALTFIMAMIMNSRLSVILSVIVRANKPCQDLAYSQAVSVHLSLFAPPHGFLYSLAFLALSQNHFWSSYSYLYYRSIRKILDSGWSLRSICQPWSEKDLISILGKQKQRPSTNFKLPFHLLWD